MLQLNLEIGGGVCQPEGLQSGGLDLHHAALGCLTLPGLPSLHLPGSIEAEVGMSRSLLGPTG